MTQISRGSRLSCIENPLPSEMRLENRLKKKKLYTLLVVLSLLGYAWVGWNVTDESEHESVPTFCLFKEVTGIPCPSCGTTRSLVALVHGDLKEALLVNPLGILMALALLIVPTWIIADMLRRSDSFFRNYNLMERVFASNRFIVVLGTVLILLNWFWNIKKGL